MDSMDKTEQDLRQRARNSDNDARRVLADLLTEQGRMHEMPFLIENWRKSLHRLVNTDFLSRGMPLGLKNDVLTLWNGWSFSIQADALNYCEPRISSSDLSVYTAWEVAIFMPNRRWFNVRETLPEVGARLEFENGDVPVAGWVSDEDITWAMKIVEAITT